MPEDTLNYKVNIDSSDIASQLEQVRGQIDSALGAMTFGAAASSASFDSPITSAGGSFIEMNPYNTINAVSSAFENQVFSTSSLDSQGLSAFIGSASEAFNLGYGKFSTGLRQMGLMTEMPPLIQYPQTGMDTFSLNLETIQNAPLFSQAPAHPVGSLGASLGVGYDNHMPMTYNEYTTAARGRLSQTVSNALVDWGPTAALAGLSFTPLAPVAAPAALAMGALELGAWIGGDRIEERNEVAKGFQQIASHTLLGGLGKTASRGVADSVLREARSATSIRTGVDTDFAQESLLGFADAGGFDSVRTAEEFERTALEVVKNTKKVMTTLRTTQSEALKVMADLQREGLVDVGDMDVFSSNMAGLGQITGMGSANVMNFVRQGAEMFRGSTLGMGGGMNLMADAIQDTRDMLRGSDMGRTIVRELGGVEQATIGRVESNVNFMNSTLGLLSYNNWEKGGTLGNRQDILGNAAGMNAFDVLKMRYRQDQAIADGELDQSDIARQRLATPLKKFVASYELMHDNANFWDPDDVKENLGAFHYWNVQEGNVKTIAESMDLFQQFITNDAEQKLQETSATLRNFSKPQDVGWWDQFTGNAGEWWHSNVTRKMGFTNLGEVSIDLKESIGKSLSGKVDVGENYSTSEKKYIKTLQDVARGEASDEDIQLMKDTFEGMQTRLTDDIRNTSIQDRLIRNNENSYSLPGQRDLMIKGYAGAVEYNVYSPKEVLSSEYNNISEDQFYTLSAGMENVDKDMRIKATKLVSSLIAKGDDHIINLVKRGKVREAVDYANEQVGKEDKVNINLAEVRKETIKSDMELLASMDADKLTSAVSGAIKGIESSEVLSAVDKKLRKDSGFGKQDALDFWEDNEELHGFIKNLTGTSSDDNTTNFAETVLGEHSEEIYTHLKKKVRNTTGQEKAHYKNLLDAATAFRDEAEVTIGEETYSFSEAKKLLARQEMIGKLGVTMDEEGTLSVDSEKFINMMTSSVRTIQKSGELSDEEYEVVKAGLEQLDRLKATGIEDTQKQIEKELQSIGGSGASIKDLKTAVNSYEDKNADIGIKQFNKLDAINDNLIILNSKVS